MHLEVDTRKLGEIDVSALAEKVAALPEDEWRRDVARQKKFDVHVATQTIWLIYDPDFRHRFPTRREMMDQFEPIMAPLLSTIDEFYAASPPEKIVPEKQKPNYYIRIILTRLSAGGEISRHRDGGYSLQRCHRIHVPIITNEDCKFRVGETVMRMRAGEIWEINNRLQHAVNNDGADARVHMILDYVRPGEVVNDPNGSVVA